MRDVSLLIAKPVENIGEALIDVCSFPVGYVFKHCTNLRVSKGNDKASLLYRRVMTSP